MTWVDFGTLLGVFSASRFGDTVSADDLMYAVHLVAWAQSMFHGTNGLCLQLWGESGHGVLSTLRRPFLSASAFISRLSSRPGLPRGAQTISHTMLPDLLGCCLALLCPFWAHN